MRKYLKIIIKLQKLDKKKMGKISNIIFVFKFVKSQNNFISHFEYFILF